jgi:two-component system LytT family response regulator
MNTLRAIIVDDEQKARHVLGTLLQEHCPQVQLVGEAANVPAALQAIHQLQPDIVFLDIEMPGYSGLQLMELVERPTFQVVFTTAYSEYALQAFEVSAIDYLLKPIRIDKLVAAVDKVARYHAGHQTPQRVEALRQNMRADTWQQLVLPLADGYLFLSPHDIELLEAEGGYTRILKTDQTSLLVTRLIRDFEKHLGPAQGFFRCHRSFIINLQRLSRWVRSDGGMIVMQSGREVPISRDRRDELEQLIAAGKV